MDVENGEAKSIGAGMMPVFVIHARHLTQRRKRLERHLARRLALPLTWVTEFDPPEIDEATRARFFREGHRLSLPEMSCCLKHLSATRRFLEDGAPYGLFMEDDIYLRLGFRRRLRRAIAELERESKAAVAYLSSGHNVFVSQKEIVPGKLLYPAKGSRTADLYLLTREAARRRVDYAETRKIGRPPDHHCNESDPASGISMFWSHPHMAIQLSLSGLMEGTVPGEQKPAPGSPWKIFWRSFRQRHLSRAARARLLRSLKR